ncbi:MAG: sensor domain-containing protein [Solirubrobacteraceae bacterium]
MSTHATFPQLAGRTVRESAYLVLDLGVGVVAFAVMISALVSGVSLAVTLVGIPILAASVLLARHAAGFERYRAQVLLGVSLAAPPALAPEPTFVRRVLAALRDRPARRASVYFLAMLPVGTVTFSAVVAWWSTVGFLVTLPAWSWSLDDRWWSGAPEVAAATVIGFVLLAATPFVIHAITRLDRAALRLIDHRQRGERL